MSDVSAAHADLEARTADDLLSFVMLGIEEFARRVAPGLELPGSYAGHPVSEDTRADLLYVVGLLIEAGKVEVSGVDLTRSAISLLRAINPADVDGFSSYRIAESVLRLGGLQAIPADCRKRAREAARPGLLLADLDKRPNFRRPNWTVVAARCLWALSRLERASDPTELSTLIERVRDMFRSTQTGWINDGAESWSQYDIYTPDMYLLALPFSAHLAPGWNDAFHKVVSDLDVLCQPSAAVVWGRSVGALSLAMTMQVGAYGASQSNDDARSRWLARVRLAVSEMRHWFAMGLISAHQGRTSDVYRSTSRRLQMSLDVYGKMLLAAAALRASQNAEQQHEVREGVGPAEVWPAVNRLIIFDDCAPSAAWTYRAKGLSFVLPVMSGASADYLVSPRQPGVFEQPVSGPPTMIPIVTVTDPPISDKPAQLAPAQVRRVVQKADGLLVEHLGWAPVGEHPRGARSIDGSRSALYNAHGRTVHVRERLTFESGVSGSVSIMVGDSPRQPLKLSVDPPGRQIDIDTDGLAEWRSHWGASSRVQQVDVALTPSLDFTWRVTRGLRVASTDFWHDYSQALYAPMTGQALIVSAGEADSGLADRLEDVDILHVAWPERWCGVDPEVSARLIRDVRQAGCKIAWTQHNLVPHRHKGTDGFATYAQWASAADLVIHHSEYGRHVAIKTHAYGDHTRHVVIPHGAWTAHFEPYRNVTRAEIEREEDWPAARLRLAVIGQPRIEKDIQLVLDAVATSTRDDLHLVARVPENTVDADSRITLGYGHTSERRYRRRMAAFDGVIIPFAAEGMLGTGTVFDCIGAGVPAITSHWGYLSEVLGAAAIEYGSSAGDLARCIDGLTPAVLARARGAMISLRNRYRWDDIAHRTLRAFEDLG